MGWSSLIRLEIAEKYRLPIPELFVGAGFLVGVLTLILEARLILTANPPFTGLQLADTIRGAIGASLKSSLGWIWLLVAVPGAMWLAVNFATDFESGLMSTYLSYPVSRSGYLWAKVGPHFLLVLGTAVGAVTIPLMFLSAIPPDPALLSVVTSLIVAKTVLVVASGLLVALVLRRAVATALVTLLAWLILPLIPIGRPWSFLIVPDDVYLLHWYGGESFSAMSVFVGFGGPWILSALFLLVIWAAFVLRLEVTR